MELPLSRRRIDHSKTRLKVQTPQSPHCRSIPWPAQTQLASIRLVLLLVVLIMGLIGLSACGSPGGSPSPLWVSLPPPSGVEPDPAVPVDSETPPPNLPSPFSIELRFVTSVLTPGQQQMFQVAAEHWMKMITSDLARVELFLPAGTCIPEAPVVNQPIDDLLIDIAITPIDGPGNILGIATPCVLRNQVLLPAYGVMRLDEEDVVRLAENDPLLEDVITHEIGHVLGIGTLWQARQLTVGVESDDPYYIGLYGSLQLLALGGVIPPFLENEGEIGTRDVHWRESAFGPELMTSVLNPFVPNPLSRLTVGSLQDLGYQVSVDLADPYQLPSTSVQLNLTQPSESLTHFSGSTLTISGLTPDVMVLREQTFDRPFIVVDRFGNPIATADPKPH